MKQYACLSCGFIHYGKKIIRERIDVLGGGSHYPRKPFHGFITYRVCPECSKKQQIKVEEDKKN